MSELEHELHILEEIERDPNVTQADLATLAVRVETVAHEGKNGLAFSEVLHQPGVAFAEALQCRRKEHRVERRDFQFEA